MTMQDFVDIVVIHAAGISDTLMATPVASTLTATYPAARITWVVNPSVSELLLSFCPHINEVIEVEPRAGLMQQLSSLKGLKFGY